MPVRPSLATLPIDPPFTLWGSCVGVLAVGAIASFIGLFSAGNTALTANMNGQRAVIDPNTGHVSLMVPKPAAQAFDVSAPEAKPAATTEPAQNTEAETHAPVSPSEGDDLPADLPALRTEPLSITLPESNTSAAESLVPAPAPEITEEIDGLKLPKRGEKAFAGMLYAKRFARTPDQHLISIVVVDAGLSDQSLPLIMRLPKQVTVAFSAYTPDVAGRIATLRRAGYEAWGMLPAMNTRFPQDDPGPLGLLASLPKEELMHRLRVVLAGAIGSAGMVLPADEALNGKEARIVVGDELNSRGLYLLAANPQTTPEQRAAEKKLRDQLRRADVLLTSDMSDAEADAVVAKLGAALEKEKETAILVVPAEPARLLWLVQWLSAHPFESPVTLAPLSAHWLPKEQIVAPEPAAEEGGGHGGGEKKDAKKEEKKSSGGH